jgi:hypothetical protein
MLTCAKTSSASTRPPACSSGIFRGGNKIVCSLIVRMASFTEIMLCKNDSFRLYPVRPRRRHLFPCGFLLGARPALHETEIAVHQLFAFYRPWSARVLKDSLHAMLQSAKNLLRPFFLPNVFFTSRGIAIKRNQITKK